MARRRLAAQDGSGTAEPLRYAHPFFTVTPPTERPDDFSPFGPRMATWIAQQSGPIPPPRTKASLLELSQILGGAAVEQIAQAGAIRFHAVGDTGRTDVHTSQEAVGQQMAADYRAGDDAHNPAFFLHLGDVIYGPNKDQLYRDEFYRPYTDYPGKIVALAGNHDGETFPATDPRSLRAFRANFCARQPRIPALAAQVRIFRQTMTQPAVYYLLRAPFVDIVALYSNIAEGPGSLVGANNDQSQKNWLAATLRTIARERAQGTRKALLFATHHPPFSNGGHGDSPQMLADLDQACSQAGLQPDAVLSGHAHNYQRHTRTTSGGRTIPYIVAGCGGHNDAHVDKATGQQSGDHTFDKSFRGYGYLLITATANNLRIDFQGLDGEPQPYDTVETTIGPS